MRSNERMSPLERVLRSRDAWDDGRMDLPDLVTEIERAVPNPVEEDVDDPLSKAIFGFWGRLELINAKALSGDVPLTPESVRDIGIYLDGLIILLDGYTGTDEDSGWEQDQQS